ncbi:ArsC/Spx/MgsR family protein [Lactococcus sp. DD01]|uniref:ArsC/Spx/MgsR family protein n=1 Tax=Lactococcus sp. DD01 TaxID=1776443 RepID=UPI00077684B3|nr:ArsC/Spx/MgsR family protein [Lactococcus sp. DD01]
MIILYYSVSSTSSIQALSWFENREIEVHKKKIKNICKTDLIHCLSLSSDGFLTILKNPNKARSEYLEQLKSLDKLNFDQAVEFILEHSHLLRVPLILDDNKLLVGYNQEEIRTFLSTEYRFVELSQGVL